MFQIIRCESNKVKFIQFYILKILEPYKNEHDKELQATAYMTLAHIIEEKDNHILKDTGIHYYTLSYLIRNSIISIQYISMY